jgi:formylglycine-generating enzyme required for sulfatase activity
MLPVGSLEPNDLGLFDLLGNAEEWVHDAYVERYVAGEDTGGPSDNQALRVLRGGSFVDHALLLRSAARDRFPAGNRSDYFGFRPARTIR